MLALSEILSGTSNCTSSLESPMETVAGSTATVTETLEKNDEGESGDVKKETNGGEQKIVEKKPGKDVSKS